MNILFFGVFPTKLDGPIGGIESSILGICNELSKSNKISIIAFPKVNLKKDFERSFSFGRVYYLKNYFKFHFFSFTRIFNIIKLVKKISPNIVHIHGTGNIQFLLFIALKILNIPSILTVHGILSVELKNIYNRRKNLKNLLKYYVISFIEKAFFYFNADFLVNTEYVKNKVIDLSFNKFLNVNSPKKFTIIPQGIDNLFFDLTNTNKSQNKLFISVGSISERKGHLVTIKIFKQIIKEFNNVRLIIAGKLLDDDYYHKLKSEIISLKSKDAIQLLVDIERSELLDLYKEANFFVLHSEEESQGIVFCEAMALGLPIISTNVGGVPSIVKNLRNGLISDYNNKIDFKKNIISLLNSKHLQEELKLNNISDSFLYRWDNISKTVFRAYLDILKRYI